MKEIRRRNPTRPRRSKRPMHSDRQHEAQGRPAANQEAIRSYREQRDQSSLGLYTLDRRGCICEVNEVGANMLGFDAAWLIDKAFVVFVARQDVQRFLDFMMHPSEDSDPRLIELDMYVSDRTQPVQISMTTSGKDSSLRHRIAVLDLTAFRRKEKLLEDSVEYWHSLIENAPDTIMTVDNEGRILFVNKPTWGYSIDALIGSRLVEHMPESDRPKLLRCLRQSSTLGRRTTCEVTEAPGKGNRWFSFSFGPPHTSILRKTRAGLTTTTTTVVIREISESKRTEEILRLSGEQLRDFAARLEAVREEERTRVAREIHDELGQALTALKLDLAWVQGKSRRVGEIRKRLKAMTAHVDDTIERVRRISSELRPSILDELGLVPAIEWQIAQFRKRTGIRTEIVANADGLSLTPEASAAVFRVVQEGLTNIMRHAKATRMRINLALINDTLRISIIDNGQGIAQGQQTELRSLGIVGMKERIARLRGEFNIFSEPGKGTRLDIVIPTHHD